jgi:single-strand DNA-binding protein
MSISKAVIMGTVVRDPEKRYTTNNIPITSFSINMSNKDEALVRIITKGKLAEVTADTVKKDKVVIIEGRLQTYTAKTTSGTDKKGVEIDAQSVEVVGETARAASEGKEIEGISYDEEISSDDLIGEDEIPF